MDKRKSLDIIIKCAKQFEQNLNNQNVLFVALEKDGRCSFIESVFKERNFLHLTGVDTPLSSREFYRSCIDNTLSVQHINYKNNFTELKLQVLSDAMSIDKTAKMIGDYNEGGIDLYTHKLVGTIAVCVGMLKERNGFYVPNSVLKADTRNISIPPVLKIACVLKKHIRSQKYETIVSIGKNIDLHNLKLPQEVVDKLSDTLKEKFGLPITTPTL